MQHKNKKILRPDPWPTNLPTCPHEAAATFSDIVTMLENYRPATLLVTKLPKDDGSRSLVESEIENIAYELDILRREFDLQNAYWWEEAK
jgi:hypothetical protein